MNADLGPRSLTPLDLEPIERAIPAQAPWVSAMLLR
jgi:hypothetical protein